MQQQKKLLDQQLNSNNLTRIPSSVAKPKLSLFRALSLSLYFNEEHVQDVIRVLRLCLLSSCSSKSTNSNAFGSSHRKVKFIEKFIDSEEAIDMYIEDPDRQNFIHDNLQLASLAYKRRLILFKMSKDMYLQENLITACASKLKEPPIMIAKISNRFFCVQSQATRSVMMFVRQNVVNQMINFEIQRDIKLNKQDPYNEQYSPKMKPRVHKKSLSDCGDIMMFNSEAQKLQNGLYVQQHNEHSHSIQDYEQTQHVHEFFYPYPPMLPSQPRLERTNSLSGTTSMAVISNNNIPANQRHSGRLKFFDHNGNYGFIVVDGYGSDLFVHYDDLQKTGIAKERFHNIRNSEDIRFEFMCLEYDGKHKKSKKAVDLVTIE